MWLFIGQAAQGLANPLERAGRWLARREANGRPSPQAARHGGAREGRPRALPIAGVAAAVPGVPHGGEGRGRATGWGEAGPCSSSCQKLSGWLELSRGWAFSSAPVTGQG